MKWQFAGRQFEVADVDGAAVTYHIAESEALQPKRADGSAVEVEARLEAHGAELAAVTTVSAGPTDYAGLFRTDDGELFRIGLREKQAA